MDIWLTSDHHFGHANIINFCERPWRRDSCEECNGEGHVLYHTRLSCPNCNGFGSFPDVDWMNQALIDKWNEYVKHGDIVYYLGDFAMGRGTMDTVERVLPRLNGEKHLIAGNHDLCWGGRGKGQKYVPRYIAAGFETIQTDAMLEGFLLHHFPYTVDWVGPHNGKDKFNAVRPRRSDWNDAPLIHGHVHDAWKTKGADQVNVGIDVWDYRPAHFDEVKELFL